LVGFGATAPGEIAPPGGSATLLPVEAGFGVVGAGRGFAPGAGLFGFAPTAGPATGAVVVALLGAVTASMCLMITRCCAIVHTFVVSQ